MASKQELQVQQKRELETKQETTIPARTFLPTADIFEAEDALHVVLEMPGVEKDNINISVRDGVLSIDGRLDFSKYKDLHPSIPNTMSEIIREASAFRAPLIRTRSAPNCAMACSR